MEAEQFVITVNYKGALSDYNAELKPWGYSWRITVIVNDQEIIFEPDEERNLRAMIADESLRNKIDSGLVKSIGEVLEELFKK